MNESVNYIYVMKNQRNGFFKIGSSKNPEYREETLQAEEPEIVKISATPGPKEIERQLHRLFSDKRLRGEWFRLTDEEAETIPNLITAGVRELEGMLITTPNRGPRVFCAYRLLPKIKVEIARIAELNGISKAKVIEYMVAQSLGDDEAIKFQSVDQLIIE